MANATTHSASQEQIIADHTVVDRYDDIPQQYIDEVKKMLVNIIGESHGRGYLYGLAELENLDANYAFNATWTGAPESYTASYLRAVRTYRDEYSNWAETAGEGDFWTSASATDMMKNHLDYMRNTAGNPVSVFMFGWCWDMTWHNDPGGTIDPVYFVRWAGSSVGGFDGDERWGLDSGDDTLTGNSVSMMTYLNAVESYIASDTQTKTVFTTGPIDNHFSNETGYQRYLKHEYIRNYVKGDSGRILFDYADILSYNNAGEQNIGAGWTDYDGVQHNYPIIHSDNDDEYDGGEGSCHISQEGTLRLGKALWWMLARIAGWDGQ
jgi:hypothetical protein